MNKLEVVDDKKTIIKRLNELAFNVSLAKKLYPRTMNEIFLASGLEVDKAYSFNKKNHKKAEVRKLAMAHLEVDLLKNEYANN